MHTIWCKQIINTVNLVFRASACVCVFMCSDTGQKLCQAWWFWGLEIQCISPHISVFPQVSTNNTLLPPSRIFTKCALQRALFGLRKMSTKIKLIFSMCAYSGLGTPLCARDTRKSQIWFYSPWAQSPVEETNLEKYKCCINKGGSAESQGKTTHSSQALGQGRGGAKPSKERGIFKLGSEGLFEVGSDKGRGSH